MPWLFYRSENRAPYGVPYEEAYKKFDKLCYLFYTKISILIFFNPREGVLMELARCKKVVYRQGSYELCQGVKGYVDGKMKDGKWFANRGHG